MTSTEDKIAVWHYKRQEKDLYRFLIRCSWILLPCSLTRELGLSNTTKITKILAFRAAWTAAVTRSLPSKKRPLPSDTIKSSCAVSEHKEHLKFSKFRVIRLKGKTPYFAVCPVSITEKGVFLRKLTDEIDFCDLTLSCSYQWVNKVMCDTTENNGGKGVVTPPHKMTSTSHHCYNQGWKSWKIPNSLVTALSFMPRS